MKLLSQDSRRDPQRHQYCAGMKNCAYLAGYVRDRTAHGNSFRIQLTNNENLLLPVLLPPGIRLPEEFRERAPMKSICQIRGGKHPVTGEQIPVVYARSFSRANILELPRKSAFEKRVPPEAPDDASFKPFGSGFRPTDACNQVVLAGYVAGIELRRPSVDGDGKEINGRCTILLRQSRHPEEAIPVTMYGKWTEQVVEIVRPGMALFVEGKYRVRPVKYGEAGADGKQPVIAVPYIHVDPPQLPGEDDIIYLRPGVKEPDWLIELKESFARRRAPAQSSAEQSSRGNATAPRAVPIAVPQAGAAGLTKPNGAVPSKPIDASHVTF